MMWALCAHAMGTSAVRRLFELTAVPDRENKRTFPFKQASVLAEYILRAVSHFASDQVFIAVEVLLQLACGEDMHCNPPARRYASSLRR